MEKARARSFARIAMYAGAACFAYAAVLLMQWVQGANGPRSAGFALIFIVVGLSLFMPAALTFAMAKE